jgi:hypothetical protein
MAEQPPYGWRVPLDTDRPAGARQIRELAEDVAATIKQVEGVYPTPADRDAANPVPVDGTTCWVRSLRQLQVFTTGYGWAPIGGAVPRGRASYPQAPDLPAGTETGIVAGAPSGTQSDVTVNATTGAITINTPGVYRFLAWASFVHPSAASEFYLNVTRSTTGAGGPFTAWSSRGVGHTWFPTAGKFQNMTAECIETVTAGTIVRPSCMSTVAGGRYSAGSLEAVWVGLP